MPNRSRKTNRQATNPLQLKKNQHGIPTEPPFAYEASRMSGAADGGRCLSVVVSIMLPLLKAKGGSIKDRRWKSACASLRTPIAWSCSAVAAIRSPCKLNYFHHLKAESQYSCLSMRSAIADRDGQSSTDEAMRIAIMIFSEYLAHHSKYLIKLSSKALFWVNILDSTGPAFSWGVSCDNDANLYNTNRIDEQELANHLNHNLFSAVLMVYRWRNWRFDFNFKIWVQLKLNDSANVGTAAQVNGQPWFWIFRRSDVGWSSGLQEFQKWAKKQGCKLAKMNIRIS